MKTILDLPENLVEDEIFSRLPIPSLKSVRSTCKKWNILCKSRIFLGEETKKHFLMLDKRRIGLMNFDLREPSIKQLSSLAQIQVSKVFQCDGMLLCVLEDDSSRLLIWNPFLGQTRWIESRHGGFHSSDRFALGYDNNNLNHEILRISSNEQVLGFELYEFSSSSWKVLDDVTSEHVLWSHARGGVSLKGNTYFRASAIGSFLCFDFTAERALDRFSLSRLTLTTDYIFCLSLALEKSSSSPLCINTGRHVRRSRSASRIRLVLVLCPGQSF